MGQWVRNERKNPFTFLLFALIGLLLLGMLLAVLTHTVLFTQQPQQTHQRAVANMQHYEYIFPDGWTNVYDMNHHQTIIKSIHLPTTQGVRGTIATAATGILLI